MAALFIALVVYSTIRLNTLDRTIGALADSTRRSILELLGTGESRVTELARIFPMSLAAVSKHIQVLEGAGLVGRRRQGRDHWIYAQPGAIDEAVEWIDRQRVMWNANLDELETVLRSRRSGAKAMDSVTSKTLVIERHLPFRAEEVFDAWTNPEVARKWLFGTPTGSITRFDMNARVGGTYAIVRMEGGDEYEHVGEYLEVDRPTRLVFSFSVPSVNQQKTIVRIDIVPLTDGCKLTLTHDGVLPEWADKTNEGWNMLIDAMARTLGS